MVDLPHPDSPASPTVSPGSMREVDAAHGGDVDAAGAVGHVQVLQLENRIHQRARSRGSRISSSARPHIVNASTTSTIPMPAGR